MKKILTLAALFVGLSISAMAQDSTKAISSEVRKEVKHKRHSRELRMKNKSPEQIATLKTERLDKELKFTDQQKKEVYAFQLDKAQKWKNKRKEMRDERQVRREELKAEFNAFQELLTPEQKELLKNKIAHNKKDQINDSLKDSKRNQMRHKRNKIKTPVEKPVVDKIVESSNG